MLITISCFRRLRLIFRHYLVVRLPSSDKKKKKHVLLIGFAIQVISLIIGFYAFISWFLSENCNVAIVSGEWKTWVVEFDNPILYHEVSLRGEKHFSSTKSYCYCCCSGFTYIEIHFSTKSLVISSSLFISTVNHCLLFNHINIIYGNSYHLLNAIGNPSSHLLNILIHLTLCLTHYPNYFFQQPHMISTINISI